MSSEPKYGFYEKVLIATQEQSKANINHEVGAVLGRAKNDEGIWIYAVHIYRDAIVWSLFEQELLPTGEFDVKDSFYRGAKVKVPIDSSAEEYDEKMPRQLH